MMNTDGIHLPTVDIFTCFKDLSVNSEYFIKWIETAAFRLRADNGMMYLFCYICLCNISVSHKIGPQRRICIVIDNAPWHCELIDSCKPVKRSWNKDKIKQWLNNRSIDFDPLWSKAELLEIASVNRPKKRYKVTIIQLLLFILLLFKIGERDSYGVRRGNCSFTCSTLLFESN